MLPTHIMLKKIGSLAIAAGVSLMIVMVGAMTFLPDYAVSEVYFLTAGVYFVMIGFAVWIAGAAKERKDQKIQEQAAVVSGGSTGYVPGEHE